MELYAIIRKMYDITGKITNHEVFDSDNDLGVLMERARGNITDESLVGDFRGFSLDNGGDQGEFKSQDTFIIVYTDGLYRTYNIVDVNTAKKIRISYVDELAEIVGSNLIDYSTRCAEIKAANIETYHIRNKFDNVIHEMADFEENRYGVQYTTLCGATGSHFDVVYKDSVNVVECQSCIDIREGA